MVPRKDLQDATIQLYKVRKDLDDYETLHGNGHSAEHSKLMKLFNAAAATFLRLSNEPCRS